MLTLTLLHRWTRFLSRQGFIRLLHTQKISHHDAVLDGELIGSPVPALLECQAEKAEMDDGFEAQLRSAGEYHWWLCVVDIRLGRNEYSWGSYQVGDDCRCCSSYQDVENEGLILWLFRQ